MISQQHFISNYFIPVISNLLSTRVSHPRVGIGNIHACRTLSFNSVTFPRNLNRELKRAINQHDGHARMTMSSA